MDLLPLQQKCEQLAEEILMEKQANIDYDRRRQELQRAQRELRKSSNKVFIFSNGLFLKQTRENSTELVSRDLKSINNEIDNIYASIKQKTATLNSMINIVDQKRLKSFELQGISSKELQDILQ